jgi:hypothetical protein
MLRTRSPESVHASPRRLGSAVALLLAVATACLIAACGGGQSTPGAGATTGAGETMGTETAAPTAGY